MIPDIGLLIGAYVSVRLLEILVAPLRPSGMPAPSFLEASGRIVVKCAAIGALIATVLIGVDLIFRGPTPLP